MPVEFSLLDISELLDSEEMIAGYLSAAAEDEDPNVLIGALTHAAKARGMMNVAKAAGLNRESLYKALRPGAHPRFETVQAVLRALGVKLAVSARATADVEKTVAGGGRTVDLGEINKGGSVVLGKTVVLDEGATGNRVVVGPTGRRVVKGLTGRRVIKVIEAGEIAAETEALPGRGPTPTASADEPEAQRKRSRASGAAHRT